jgi:hypothetical protein
MNNLSVGDVVMWKGTWGTDSAQPATIHNIAVCKTPGDQNDVSSMDSIAWSMIKGRDVVVDLVSCPEKDNNHWAWGFQIQPISKGDK